MTDALDIGRRLLAANPLPDHKSGEDKHDRGTALVVGGSVETPGAMLLAGIAALRAGAGRLQIALAAVEGAALAVAVPEAKVMTLGAIDRRACAEDLAALREALRSADAVLVGSGAIPTAAGPLVEMAIEEMAETEACLVVDAAALAVAAEDPEMFRHRAPRTLLIPNDAEAAELLGVARNDLSPAEMVAELVRRTGCTAAVRGPDTYIQGPGGSMFVERSGPVGLATSGSGDMFAGLVAGYLARGAGPLAAALWAAHIHALAGALAAERYGPVNYLARDVLELLPRAQLVNRTRWRSRAR